MTVRKGQQTRDRIVQESAALFNTRGYAGTAMSDIIEAAGIQKGGIYRHFESKDEIALAAFEYAMTFMIRHISEAVDSDTSAVQQLTAICNAFAALLDNPTLPGGCPLFNTAVEADDTHPLLKASARAAFDQLRALVQHIVKQGKARGELHSYVNGDIIASILISSCEGALALSRLYGQELHLRRVIDHLTAYFETLAQPPATGA